MEEINKSVTKIVESAKMEIMSLIHQEIVNINNKIDTLSNRVRSIEEEFQGVNREVINLDKKMKSMNAELTEVKLASQETFD